MTQEERAKAYDEALEKARQLCAYPTTKPFISDLQDIFPELKESEDERIRKVLLGHFSRYQKEEVFLNNITIGDIVAWLEKQGEKGTKRNNEEIPNSDWSEEDEQMLNHVIIDIESLKEQVYCRTLCDEEIDWLKSLRPQTSWKPSEEMLEALYRAIPENTMAISEDEMLLDKLYQGLKYGRVLSKN